MAVLSPNLFIVALLATGGCYAPDLRDCTVTCAGADECAGDQVCTGGACAAEGVTCTGGGATVDAAATFALLVRVEGDGKVVVEGVGECTKAQQPCTWMVPAQPLRFTAQQTESDKPFERWTTMNCAPATQPSCNITATASTTVGAKFK